MYGINMGSDGIGRSPTHLGWKAIEIGTLVGSEANLIALTCHCGKAPSPPDGSADEIQTFVPISGWRTYGDSRYDSHTVRTTP